MEALSTYLEYCKCIAKFRLAKCAHITSTCRVICALILVRMCHGSGPRGRPRAGGCLATVCFRATEGGREGVGRLPWLISLPNGRMPTAPNSARDKSRNTYYNFIKVDSFWDCNNFAFDLASYTYRLSSLRGCLGLRYFLLFSNGLKIDRITGGTVGFF